MSVSHTCSYGRNTKVTGNFGNCNDVLPLFQLIVTRNIQLTGNFVYFDDFLLLFQLIVVRKIKVTGNFAHFLSSFDIPLRECRRWRCQHRSRVSCGRGTTWTADTATGSMTATRAYRSSETQAHRQVKTRKYQPLKAEITLKRWFSINLTRVI